MSFHTNTLKTLLLKIYIYQQQNLSMEYAMEYNNVLGILLEV